MMNWMIHQKNIPDTGTGGTHIKPDTKKEAAETTVSHNARIAPHNMDSEVSTSLNRVELTCPQCGRSTIHVEFPDQYEALIECSCGFFMGMSNDD